MNKTFTKYKSTFFFSLSAFAVVTLTSICSYKEGKIVSLEKEKTRTEARYDTFFEKYIHCLDEKNSLSGERDLFRKENKGLEARIDILLKTKPETCTSSSTLARETIPMPSSIPESSKELAGLYDSEGWKISTVTIASYSAEVYHG